MAESFATLQNVSLATIFCGVEAHRRPLLVYIYIIIYIIIIINLSAPCAKAH